MNTILSDGERRAIINTGRSLDDIACAIEAAVLAKLREQEPVAMRYDFDGYGYRYIDSGSGSDWQTRISGAEPVYATPLPAVAQVLQGLAFQLLAASNYIDALGGDSRSYRQAIDAATKEKA